MNAAALMLTATGIATVVALLVRLKRSQGVERQQVKWLTYAGALAISGLVLLLPGDVGLGSPSASLDLAGTVLTAGGGLALPIAVGLAILRYRLFDIDLLIARTVVYGLLSAGFTVIYLAIVVGVGTLVGSGDKPNVLLSVVATGVIAVAFQPARDRSRRLANRLVYGSRATPYEVLSTFSRELASASSDDSLQRLARLVVEATSAVQASVWLRLGDVLQPQVSWPPVRQLPEPVALQSRGVNEALAVAEPSSLPFPVEHDERGVGRSDREGLPGRAAQSGQSETHNRSCHPDWAGASVPADEGAGAVCAGTRVLPPAGGRRPGGGLTLGAVPPGGTRSHHRLLRHPRVFLPG